MTIQRIVSQIEISSAYIGDKICEPGLGCDIEHPKSLGEGSVRLRFAPLDRVGIKKTNPWRVSGLMFVSCRLGAFTIPINLEFRLDEEDVKALVEEFAK